MNEPDDPCAELARLQRMMMRLEDTARAEVTFRGVKLRLVVHGRRFAGKSRQPGHILGSVPVGDRRTAPRKPVETTTR